MSRTITLNTTVVYIMHITLISVYRMAIKAVVSRAIKYNKWGYYLCQFWLNRSRNATVRDRRTDANWFYNLSHAIFYKGKGKAEHLYSALHGIQTTL